MKAKITASAVHIMTPRILDPALVTSGGREVVGAVVDTNAPGDVAARTGVVTATGAAIDVGGGEITVWTVEVAAGIAVVTEETVGAAPGLEMGHMVVYNGIISVVTELSGQLVTVEEQAGTVNTVVV
jgi:hypothetical protein